MKKAIRDFVQILFVISLASLGLSAGDRGLLVAADSSQRIQNLQADSEDLSRMRNVAMVQRFARGNYLVPVPWETDTYYLHNIAPPYRYCRPWTRIFLQRLSAQYYSRFHERLRITSLVRTTGSQTRLARSNANAADAVGSLRSSHLTGASIDISKRFMSPEGQQWIRNVLYSLKQQGYLYAIEEFYQPTFHVMVYRSYPTYVRGLHSRKAQVARNRHSATAHVTPVADVQVPKRPEDDVN